MTDTTDDQTIGAASAIDDLCRAAAELIGSTGGPLKSVRVRAGDLSVEVEWPDAGDASAAAGPPNGTGRVAAPETGAADAAGSFVVTAPLVGTFYRAPNPGAKPFVEVGDSVAEGQQVAIVEAMKLLNAVTAEQAGRVTEVLVNDAAPVEYGEPLIVLESA
jgi:acetyl-CoA carboxylase biotin carboxyl carrier protein